jgi:uncharacterized protein YjbI with pentapeptide repeats
LKGSRLSRVVTRRRRVVDSQRRETFRDAQDKRSESQRQLISCLSASATSTVQSHAEFESPELPVHRPVLRMGGAVLVMARHGIALLGMTLHEMALHGMTLHGMTLHGMTLHGMTLHGMTLHGMALLGMTLCFQECDKYGVNCYVLNCNRSLSPHTESTGMSDS